MPLIMDEGEMDVDIDDLFGDGGALSLPPRPLPKEIFQRVDELRARGCSQRIAWSKWGCLASITPDSAGLEFRNLRCHPRDGTWDLSDPTVFPQVTPTLDGGPLQHVCWSPNGSDLAAIDAAGRASILTLANSLNKPSLTRSSQVDPTEDIHAVVGAYWLNLFPIHQRPAVMQNLAVKVNDEYRYEVNQPISFGPCHPNAQKSALVCLTTNGVLRLIWPQSDGKWYETTSEIESVVSSDDLITHASICADKNTTLLMAFVTTTKQLRTVRIAIKWGNKSSDKPINPSQVIVNPSIIIRHIAVTNWLDRNSTDGAINSNVSSSMLALSHLEIFPPAPDGPAGQSTLPTIITVRSHIPNSPSQYNQETFSIIDRWELRESTPSIHPAFQQLSARRDSTTQSNIAMSFSKMDGFMVNKIFLGVHSISLDRILCFLYSDGCVEFRDRLSLAEIYTEGDLNRFSHLSQIGFSFHDDDPCLHMAMSPTSYSVVQIGVDGKHKWKLISHPKNEGESETDRAHYAGALAGLTMACSTAVMCSINYDDLFVIAHNYTSSSRFQYDWLTEISRVLKFILDYSEEAHHDTLIRNPSVQLCLSIQNSLGYKGDGHPRAFSAKLAWISLQIRNCVVLMTMAANMKVPDPELQKKISGLEDAEAIQLLSGSVRWCLDLMAWLVDSLLHPENPEAFKSMTSSETFDLDKLNSSLVASNNVALHLLLSSATRGFLTAICRRLSHLEYTARKASQSIQQIQAGGSGQIPLPLISNMLRASYSVISTLTNGSIIQIRTFETFLTSISASVKEAYTAAGLAPAPQPHTQQKPVPQPTGMTRNTVEQIMLFGGPLPESLIPAMTNLFSSLLPTLRSGIDPAKLFFHDFSLLSLDPFPATDSALHNLMGGSLTSPSHEEGEPNGGSHDRVAHTIDIFQRIPVVLGQDSAADAEATSASGVGTNIGLQRHPRSREGRQWRRCARCAAVMEDISSHKPAVQFLIMQQRRCFCGGNWDILSGKQLVA